MKKMIVHKIFDPEEYGMMFCTECAGSGHCNDGKEMTVCRSCGGFGLIKKRESEFKDKRTMPQFFG